VSVRRKKEKLKKKLPEHQALLYREIAVHDCTVLQHEILSTVNQNLHDDLR